MTRLSLFVVFLLPIFLCQAQTFQTSGNWNSASNWSTGSVPTGSTTDVSIQNSRNPTLNTGANNTIGNISVGTSVTFTVSTGATLTLGSSSQFNATPTQDKRSMTVTNSATLNVNTSGGSGDGLLEIWGDLIVGTSLQMNIRGNLIIHGNFVMQNSGQVNVTGGGTITVYGNFTGGTGSQLTVSGGGSTIAVTGALNLGNSSQITTSGGGSITASSCTCSGCSGQCGSVTLPIELLYFSGSANANKVDLSWATASELNFDYFDIQKSLDGIIFKSISNVKGHGTTQERNDYKFADEKPVIGKNYYRLTSVDFDGYTETFGVILVDYEGRKTFSIYPNPADGVAFKAETNFTPDQNAYVTIFTASGKEVGRYQVTGDLSDLTMPVRLESGWYYARFISSEFTAVSRFLVK